MNAEHRALGGPSLLAEALYPAGVDVEAQRPEAAWCPVVTAVRRRLVGAIYCDACTGRSERAVGATCRARDALRHVRRAVLTRLRSEGWLVGTGSPGSVGGDRTGPSLRHRRADPRSGVTIYNRPMGAVCEYAAGLVGEKRSCHRAKSASSCQLASGAMFVGGFIPGAEWAPWLR
jgi:hypothetical protein